MPATYFVHGLGYTPTMMSAHTLPTAAFLSAGVDSLTYATIPYAQGAAAQAYDAMTSNVGSDAATTSELSPGSTQNGVVDSNGAGNFAPPGYGSRHFLPASLNFILIELIHARVAYNCGKPGKRREFCNSGSVVSCTFLC